MTTWTAIKVGDTVPGPRHQLFGSDGTAINLTGATVVMQTPGEDPLAVTVSDPPNGVVRVPRGTLAPANGALKTMLRVEFQITYSNGDIQTVPDDGHDVLPVWQDLDDAE